MNVFAAANWAKALAGKPPSRPELSFGTSVVDFTESGGVPVAKLEISCCALRFPVTVSFPVAVGNDCPEANVISPLLLTENPVSARAPVPEANSKFNLPDGEVVSFPTDSACQRKC